MRQTAIVLFALAVLASTSPAAAADGLVALVSGDASCNDGSGKRYVDCGNGTVTDTLTGLIWLKDASCFDRLVWADAMLTVAGLSTGQCGLSDNSSPGEWRLPSIAEWAATVAPAVALSCTNPSLTNDAGTNCFAAGAGSSFVNLATGTPVYWSATTQETAPGNVTTANLVDGNTTTATSKNNTNWIWPVRRGQ